jgi:hypothetical protein
MPEAEYSFHLDVIVKRRDVVEWLQGLPSDRLDVIVENTLAAGHVMLALCQASAGEESMGRFFRPVVSKMEELKGTIDGLLRATQKSKGLGEIGEVFLVEQLQHAFPSDTFEVVSKEGHCGDIHALFMLPTGQTRKALIEVKLYRDDVPGEELEKFRRDLDTTGIRYGLLVSLTSRLTGISAPLFVETTRGHVALYLPNAGLDGHKAICAAAYLKAIVLFDARADAAGLVPAAAIDRAWARLEAELQELHDIAAEVRGLQETLRAARQSVIRVLDDAVVNAMLAERRLQRAFQTLTNRLAGELNSLLPPAAQPLPLAEPDALQAFLSHLEDQDDKRVATFLAIRDLARRLGLQVALDNGHWQLVRDGQAVARTGGTKARLDMLVKINPEESVRVLPSLEKIKDNEIIIDGSDVTQLVARLEKRLASEAAIM